MDQRKIFKISRLSEAAYLEAVARVRCLGIEIDAEDSRRVVFVFETTPEEGRRLVLQFGSSESAAYDGSVRRFKGAIFQKLREAQAK